MKNSANLPLFDEKVLILGNRSYKNLGDELILLGTIRLLQAQGNQVIISAYNPEWLSSFFSQFKDLKPIVYIHEFPKGIRSFFAYFFSHRRKELRIYRSVDAVIVGGGEILTEESPNAYRYWNLGLLPLRSRLHSRKACRCDPVSIFLMGGIQIPHKKINLWLFKQLLKDTSAIFARDDESVLALQKFGYNQVQFFMDTSYFAYPRNTMITEKKEKIALINLNKNGAQFFNALLQECKALLEQGYQLYYVPVSKGHHADYDDLYYKQGLEKALNMTLKVLDRESDFAFFVKKLAHAEQVITARLHLFLISAFVHTKVNVYPYQTKILKMKQILEELHFLD